MNVISIVDNKKTNYHIVHSVNSTECERYACSELQKYLYESLEFTTTKERVERLLISIEYLYLVRLEMDYPNRNKLIDDFKEKILKLRITEIFERTKLNYSIEIMKKSRYAIDRKDWYSLYYIMR